MVSNGDGQRHERAQFRGMAAMNLSRRTPFALTIVVTTAMVLAACGSDVQDAATTTVDIMSDESTEPPGGTGGNNDTEVPADPTTPSTPTEDPSRSTTSSPLTATPVPPDTGLALPAGDDIDPGSTIVRAALADLAGRLDVETDQIAVLAARAVTWPDSSLGCPEPGVQYLQRITDGALVVLEVGGRRYQYHGGIPLVLCEHPAARFAVD